MTILTHSLIYSYACNQSINHQESDPPKRVQSPIIRYTFSTIDTVVDHKSPN